MFTLLEVLPKSNCTQIGNEYKYSQMFIHSFSSLTTGPKPLPKRTLHIVRSRASSFKWQYPLLSLRSSSSFLRLLPRLPVTSIPPVFFPSITRCRRQFLRKVTAKCILIYIQDCTVAIQTPPYHLIGPQHDRSAVCVIAQQYSFPPSLCHCGFIVGRKIRQALQRVVILIFWFF